MVNLSGCDWLEGCHESVTDHVLDSCDSRWTNRGMIAYGATALQTHVYRDQCECVALIMLGIAEHTTFRSSSSELMAKYQAESGTAPRTPVCAVGDHAVNFCQCRRCVLPHAPCNQHVTRSIPA